MRKRKCESIDRMVKTGRAMHARGWVSDERMTRLAWCGMPPPAPLTPEEVRAIREAEDLSIYTFANMLNTTARLLRRYEQGITRPTGPVLRLLHAIREQGMGRVFPLTPRIPDAKT
ncbi:helix-turn-helix domain-containing protein [Mitsuaria sp. CC2]|jgi:putative transcriptional regulator|uniref:helix-turn-helix domain-containing protein n=1 Tax=Mitsuaria sp. CC2 TaxID=3029186 RepID=UPI003B8E28DF